MTDGSEYDRDPLDVSTEIGKGVDVSADFNMDFFTRVDISPVNAATGALIDDKAKYRCLRVTPVAELCTAALAKLNYLPATIIAPTDKTISNWLALVWNLDAETIEVWGSNQAVSTSVASADVAFERRPEPEPSQIGHPMGDGQRIGRM